MKLRSQIYFSYLNKISEVNENDLNDKIALKCSIIGIEKGA